MAAPQQAAEKANEVLQNLTDVDYWASPTTQVFAFIGLLWVSLKIFSFWRLIASLFVLPGVSVCLPLRLSAIDPLTSSSFRPSARRVAGPSSPEPPMASAKSMLSSSQRQASMSSSSRARSRSSRASPPRSRQPTRSMLRSWPWTSQPTTTPTTPSSRPP